MPQQCRPGGSTEFSSDLSAIDGDVPKQVRSRGCRYGKDPVGALHLPAAHMNGRYDDLIRMQLVKQHGNGRYIRNRIPGPDLMKMYLLHRLPVHVSLCLRNGGIDLYDIVTDRLFQRKLHHKIPDLSERPMNMMVMSVVVVIMVGMVMVVMIMVVMIVVIVVVVIMIVVVLTLLLTMYQHPDMCPGDPAFLCGFHPVFHIRDAQPVQSFDHLLRFRKKLQKCRRQHVPGSSHTTVKIECSHRSLLPI